jgi:dUTP pyrophosphatase
MLNVQFKQVRPGAKLPQYKTPLAAGLDISACIDEPITLKAGEKSVLIPTGFAAYIGDPNYAYFIYPRSGMGHKKGLVLGNGTGVIDADYQGEVFVSACVRPGHDDVTINPGDDIAQIVFKRVERVGFEIVEEFHEVSVRGDGGFGSTDGVA